MAWNVQLHVIQILPSWEKKFQPLFVDVFCMLHGNDMWHSKQDGENKLTQDDASPFNKSVT